MGRRRRDVDELDIDALREELAAVGPVGWNLIAATPAKNSFSAARASGPLRERHASTAEALVRRVTEFEEEIAARGGVSPIVVKQGVISTGDMTISRREQP